MHIYSMFNFCVGTFVGVVGVVFLVVSLFALLKTKKLGAYQDKKQLFVSIYFALYGSHLVSRALDPPHQESQRTDIIGWLYITTAIIGIGSLYIAKRRSPKDPTA